MFLIKEKRKQGTYLCIVQSYRDPVTKVTKKKRIKNIGYLEDLMKEYDDPIAHFQQVAKEMSDEYTAENKPVQVALDPSKALEPGIDLTKNLGYTALSALYHDLKIDVFFRGRQRGIDIPYNLNSIMKLLVYGNILYLGTIKHIYNRRHLFFDKMEFTLDDLYDSFKYFRRYNTHLQKWMFKYLCEKYNCQTDEVYYYVTKQYFEIDKDSSHIGGHTRRTDPIVQLELLADKNGLPISYELSSRAPSDILTIKASTTKRINELNAKRAILVGDNGINSPNNLFYVLSNGHGYIVQQNIRSADKEIKDFVLSERGYRPFGEDGKIKSRLITRTAKITTGSGKKKTVQIKEKQIVFYNSKYARCVMSQREDMLLKANDLITTQNASGANRYVQNLKYDSPVITGTNGLNIDEETLKEEEKYDGYYLFFTSEIDNPDEDLVNAYSGLWEIENVFKYTNSAFYSPPENITREEHMYAHYLSRYISLILTRLIQQKVDYAFPLERMLYSLRKCTCIHIEDNNYIQSYFDTVLDTIGHSIGVDFSKRYGTLCKIKENIAITKKSSQPTPKTEN